MPLKFDDIYGGRWTRDPAAREPLSEQGFYVYDGTEATGRQDYYLEGRPVMLKTIRYRPGTTPEDVAQRRAALCEQMEVLALEHFMLPEPLDFCKIANEHTPGIAGSELSGDEPLLVYASLPGRTIREHVTGRRTARREPFGALEAIKVALNIADFLTYLHSQHYSHIAINPDHFLYDRDPRPDRRSRRSLRALGFGKIAPIETNGWAKPFEPPALPERERPYTHPVSLARNSFGLGNEWRGLAFLLVYMISARCPSEIVKTPSDVWPIDNLQELECCDELKGLLETWLLAKDAPFDAAAHEKNCDLLREAYESQRQADRIGEIQECEVGVFLDFENMWRAFKPRRMRNAVPQSVLGLLELNYPVFDGIANYYAQSGRVYKFASVPEFHLDEKQVDFTARQIQERIGDLERAGWKVKLVEAGADDDDEAPDDQPGMQEKDDSALVQAGEQFLKLGSAKSIVIISNDRDFLELIELARNQNVEVTVVYGKDPGGTKRDGNPLNSLNPTYRRRLEELGVTLRSIYAYPGAFSLEYEEYKYRYHLDHLPQSRSSQHRAFICTALIQLGWRGALELFDRAPGPGFGHERFLRRMESFDPTYYRFCIGKLRNAPNVRDEVERLCGRARLLRQVDPYYEELLHHVYRLADASPQRAAEVAAVADRIIDNWGILKGRLRDGILVGVYTGKNRIDPELQRLIENEPERFTNLSRNLRRATDEVVLILREGGLEGFKMLEQYGQQALVLFEKYGKGLARRMVGSQAQATIQMLNDRNIEPIATGWYKKHGNLNILDLLTTGDRRLTDMIRRGGMAAAEIYQAERSLDTVEQVFRLGRALLFNLDETYKVWRKLAQRGLNLDQAIMSVERTQQHRASPFRDEVDSDQLAPLVAVIYSADRAGDLDALLVQYSKLGHSVLTAYQAEGTDVLTVAQRYPDLFLGQPAAEERERWLCAAARAEQTSSADQLAELLKAEGSTFLNTFERYGPGLLPLIRATEPAVVAMLDASQEPGLFEALRRYGRPGYDFVKRYGPAAGQALARLEGADLTPLLTDEAALTLVDAWHARRGDLRGLDLLAKEPQLLTLAAGYGQLASRGADARASAECGQEVLAAYERDPDIGRLRGAIRLAGHVGLSLEDAHELLAQIGMPAEDAVAILTTYRQQLATMPDMDATVRWIRAASRARQNKVEQDFVSAYGGRGMAAVELVESLGAGALVALRTSGAPMEAVDLLVQMPKALPHLQRYGMPAYRFLNTFREAGLSRLESLAKYDLKDILAEPGWQVITAWYQRERNLDILVDLANNPSLLSAIYKYQRLDVVVMCRELAARYPGRAAALWQEYESVLTDPNIQYLVVLPLVGAVQPALLRAAYTKYPQIFKLYPQPAEQVRVCKLFDGRLVLERDCPAYLGLCGLIRPNLMLALVEAGGSETLSLLGKLKPRAAIEAATRLQGLQPAQIAAATAQLKGCEANWMDWTEDAQVQLIRAGQYQSYDYLLQECAEFGLDALSEIITNPAHDLSRLWKFQRKLRSGKS